MNALLTELGRKAAEHWVTRSLLPGLLFVAAGAVAVFLGHSHALDVGRLYRRLVILPEYTGTGSPLVMAIAALLVAGAAGLAAAAVGAFFGRVCSALGPRVLVQWRRRRWERADALVRDAALRAARDPSAPYPPLLTALHRRERIALGPPRRPTWIADRLLAADERLHRAYDLDLAAVWPRLWLVTPETVRAELTAAQEAYAGALRLGGWGVLYLALGPWWWPAVAFAALALGTAWHRARLRAAILADLVESTADLHARDLAAQLGLPNEGPLTKETGLAITAAVRKEGLRRP